MTGVGRWVRPAEGNGKDENGLTTVHRDTLRRLSSGDTNDEMARALGLSRHAVKDRIRRLCQALGVTEPSYQREQALAAARERGLLDQPAAERNGAST